MQRTLSHAIALGSVLASVCVLVTASCAHPATDRVLEPAGGDASPSSPATPASPLTEDAGSEPVAPVVRSVEPEHDYTAIRAPEFGGRR